MLRRIVSLAPLFILMLAVGFAPACLGITKEFNQTYPLQPGGTFELQNVNGTVDVQGWDRDTIEIHAVKTAKRKESDLELVSIDVDAKPGVVSVATRYPQNEGVEVAVEYTVHVPHQAHVEHLGTVNGNIEVYEAGGSVHAHTTNGNVHLELLRVQDTSGAIAETTNGSLLLAVPADTRADLETRCLNGNFFSELPVTFESTQKPREMHGKLGGGGAPIRLHTVNGGIRLVALRSTV